MKNKIINLCKEKCFLRSLSFLMLILVSSSTFSQNMRTISGMVLDEQQDPVPGATVMVKGNSDYGTITDSDGEFSINIPAEENVLVISFIGMKTQEIDVSNTSSITIILESEIVHLAETVVVGYGIQKKETLTGSIANISGDDIRKSPEANVTASLQGKLPGLTINQRTGEPGSEELEILIRGNGTFRDNSPLIIVDGVERSNMSRLNPDDIESISVLKDASAAIYGARAANGVIIITSKSGKEGKPEFNFSYNYAFQSPTQIPEMLDAATFAEAYNEGDWYRQGRPDEYIPFYSENAIQKYRDGSDPVLYPNTDWVDVTMRSYAPQQRTNLQVTGGSDKVTYLLSFGIMDQEGIMKNNPTHYRQYNLRSNINVNLTENLSLGANIYAILNDREYPSTYADNPDNDYWVDFYNILQANPTLPARYPNGLIAPGRLQENPLLLDRRGYYKVEDRPVYSTFKGTYKVPFVEGLKIDASFNYDLSHQFSKRWSTPYYYHEYNVNSDEYEKKWATNEPTAELTDTYNRWTTMLYNYKIVYDRDFGKHHVGAMVGQEIQKNTWNYTQAYRKNFVSSAIDQINVGSSAAEDKDNGGSASSDAYNNYFGRFNYNFESKYLFEFIFRYDGSQKFPEGKRYGFFPGFSLGWRLSEEDFMKNNLPFVNNLKLRLSHGIIGNDRVDSYQHLQSFSFGGNYVFGTSDAAGIYANTMPNPNITWEESKKTDVGLEATLWKGLFGMDLTLWKEKRSNILTQRNLSVPKIYGFPALPDENIGEVDNHGFELDLSHRNSVGELNYNISGNIAFSRSEIVYMDEVPHAEPYQNLTGHPVGAGLYYKADGIFNTQEELDAYPHASGTQVGDIKIVDLNDDGEINAEDQFRFDYSATPEYVFGLNMGLQYKNFDLSLFFQGQTNAYNYDGTFAKLGNSAFDNAVVDRAKDRWTTENTDGTMPRADDFQPGNSTFYLFDATFVRLKTMEMGYSLPESIISKLHLTDCRLYISGSNLLTWAKEIKWADPENTGDFLNYPPLRTINLGVNVKF